MIVEKDKLHPIGRHLFSQLLDRFVGSGDRRVVAARNEGNGDYQKKYFFYIWHPSRLLDNKSINMVKDKVFSLGIKNFRVLSSLLFKMFYGLSLCVHQSIKSRGLQHITAIQRGNLVALSP
jgi:hypothetical protein